MKDSDKKWQPRQEVFRKSSLPSVLYSHRNGCWAHNLYNIRAIGVHNLVWPSPSPHIMTRMKLQFGLACWGLGTSSGHDFEAIVEFGPSLKLRSWVSKLGQCNWVINTYFLLYNHSLTISFELGPGLVLDLGFGYSIQVLSDLDRADMQFLPVIATANHLEVKKRYVKSYVKLWSGEIGLKKRRRKEKRMENKN